MRDIFTEAGGFQALVTTPCAFYSERLQILSIHHGDDFLSCGLPEALDELDNLLETHLKVKKEPRLGPGGVSHATFLNKGLTWCSKGFAMQADTRHIKRVVQLLGMADAKGCDSPGTKDSWKGRSDALDELTVQDAQLYRTCVGILQYVAGDRVDLQFTTKELARALVKPTVKAMLPLKRCARYIKGPEISTF